MQRTQYLARRWDPATPFPVSLHNYQQCSPGELEYSVRVAYDNNVSTYRGTFADGTASEAASADSLKEVVRFRRADPDRALTVAPVPPTTRSRRLHGARRANCGRPTLLEATSAPARTWPLSRDPTMVKIFTCRVGAGPLPGRWFHGSLSSLGPLL